VKVPPCGKSTLWQTALAVTVVVSVYVFHRRESGGADAGEDMVISCSWMMLTTGSPWRW